MKGALGAGHDGLTSREVAIRQETYGKNKLPEHSETWITIFLRQFRGIFNYLLYGAAIIAFALGEYLDGSFVVFFILLGTLLGFFQEYKSNAAAAKLKHFLNRTISVRRDSVECEVLTEEIVPGDILLLEPGDIIPADADIREARGFLVNETTFSGESVPVSKVAPREAKDAVSASILQGTDVVKGSAVAEVTKTGAGTRFAGIAESVSAVHTSSEFSKDLDRFSVFILRMTLVTLVFVVLGNILVEGATANIPLLLIFAVSLAVSVIPEALPLVSMFSLSHGALRLATHGVIVKRLTSVQDLGSIDLLCTDKTGTLTENKLTLIARVEAIGSSYDPVLLARLAVDNLEERVAEPFDVALSRSINDAERRALAEFTLLEDEPFDPDLKSNGAIRRLTDGRMIHVRRGAPEYILQRAHVPAGSDAYAWLAHEETAGRRVLGVSYRICNGRDVFNESPFTFGGLLSFEDTLKPTAKHALLAARKLHVDVRIITGDSLRVATAVGRAVGLVETEDQALTADDLFALPPHELHEAILRVRVFARVSPEQKLELLQLLQERYSVGFLGEGINDAAALKSAGVSLVVQSASDVAREAADIVLLESDLGVIVEGIRLGRETHANTMKYVRATLASNFGNFYAVAIASLFISFLPMLPTQILLLNLLSDFPMMAIALDRVSPSEVAWPQKYDLRSLVLITTTLGLVSTAFDFTYFALFYRISPEVLQTNWFIASVVTEILFLFSIRSMRPAIRAGLPSKLIIILSITALVVTVAIPLIPFLSAFFKFTVPKTEHIVIIIGLALLYLVVSETVKIVLGRFLAKKDVAS